MRVLRAKYILPIARPPIENGWIEVADGHIVSVRAGRPPGTAEDLGDVAVLPGLVNAHTHLELSWMAARVAPAGAMTEWLRAMMAERRQAPAPDVVRAAIVDAIGTLRATGTAVVGDISNTLATVDDLQAAGLAAVVFHELVGVRVADPVGCVERAWAAVDAKAMASSGGASPTDMRISVTPHAPYSVSPGLFHAIVAAQRGAGPLSVHLGESPEEVEFLWTGGGPFKTFLEDLGVIPPDWTAPKSTPVEYLARMGCLRQGTLVVHGGHLPASDLEMLRMARAVLVTCPRSNVWVGAGAPPVSRFYHAGLHVAIGTDSLSSVPSLNMFDELAAVRALAPDVRPARLLESATMVGASALGYDDRYGSLEAGKRAALVAVEVGEDVADVEEYLVSGVPAGRVRRIDVT